ncbi:MAG: DUF3667 domain-containing protein [Prevotella sp.]|nr:DUF3667 domain-containing protein [Prevotella sp.]
MTIKRILARFRTWQRNPFGYENHSPGTTRCQNCGTEFADNYCPRCGQAASTKRLSWQSIREGVMNMWGAGNRSMPYSLLQLLGRPGNFIYDYLSGKRQVSYPPFRMLFIVAVIALFFENILPSSEAVESGADAARFVFLDKTFDWFADNPGWGMIFLCGIFILPTWVVFRFAPRYPKHTLPEGFFIQVFMGTLALLTSLLCALLDEDMVFWLIVVYYFVAYLQLFGYRVWGTLWRLVVTFISGLGILVFLIFSIEIIIKKGSTSLNHSLRAELFALALLSVLNCVLLYVSYKIGKRGWLRRSINGQQEEPMESEVEALTPGRSSKNSE